MISNLNQLSFQRFGYIQSERAPGEDSASQNEEKRILELNVEQIPLYISRGETWLRNHGGMTVISVSQDGENYQHFYLDKTVCIHADVRFALKIFDGTASSVEMWGEDPERIGYVEADEDLKNSRRLQLDSIYTFFYHEKEKGFIFPGEAHKPLELTYVTRAPSTPWPMARTFCWSRAI